MVRMEQEDGQSPGEEGQVTVTWGGRIFVLREMHHKGVGATPPKHPASVGE